MVDIENELQELKIKNKLSKVFLTMPDEKLYPEVLKIVLEAFRSRFGIFGYFDENGAFVIPAITTTVFWRKCRVADRKIIFGKADFCRVWEKAIAEKKTFFINNGPFHMPAGHIAIDNTLVSPIIFRGKIISAIHLANKSGGYDEKDSRLLAALTDYLAPVLAARLERDKTEKALKDSEELHRITVESIADPVFITDVNGNFIHIYGNITQVLGYSVTELQAMGNIRHLVDGNLFDAEQLGREKEIRNVDSTLLDKAGNRHYFLTNIKKLALHKGAILFTFHEITERIMAEEEVKRNEEKFRRLLESTFTVPWELDLASEKFTFMGNQIETLLGYPANSWKDIQTWIDRLYEEDRQQAVKFCREQTRQGKDHDFTYRAIHADGSLRWIQDVVSVVQGENGPEKLVGFLYDITDKKMAEGAKAKLERKLRQSQKMEAIGTLAGGIAHDFNNILGVIIGYTDMAIEDAPPDSICTRDLQHVLKAGYKAKDLVQQILAFSRQAKVKRFLLQPQPIIKETMKMLRSSIPTTIEIQQEIDPECGAIYADPTQIHQILINLCTNAFHAMEEQGGIIRVEMKRKILDGIDFPEYPNLKKGSYIELVVRDTGEGIDPDIKNRIFDPYFTTKQTGKGTGLGLAIVHGIIRDYGGAIRVKSTPGKGTDFHIFFPALPDKVLHQDVGTETLPTGTEQILFVDDEEMIADMGKNMLERLGYKVITLVNSFEALQIFSNNPEQFDLVITDQTMPGMTGAELAGEMLQIRPATPIILCTGYSSIISEEKAKLIGIREFLMKPIVKKDIAQLIRNVLDN